MPTRTSRSAGTLGHAVILEPEHSGHRLWYVRLIALEAQHSGLAVSVVTTPEARRSPEWQTHLAELGPVHSLEIPRSRSWRRRALVAARAMAPTTLVMPDGEPWLPSLAVRRTSCPAALLIMRPHRQPGRWSTSKWLGKRALVVLVGLRPHVRVLSLTMHEQATRPRTLTREVPDPVELDELAAGVRAAGGIAEDELLTVVMGGLDLRKGIPALLQAWAGVENPLARLAFIGRVPPQIRNDLAGLAARDPRVLVVEGYVPSPTFDGWLAAADQVVALYENVGSSGVALKAWALGTPVIVWQSSYLDSALSKLGADLVRIPAEGWLGRLTLVLSDPPAAPVDRRPVEPGVLEARTRRFTRRLLRADGS